MNFYLLEEEMFNLYWKVLHWYSTAKEKKHVNQKEMFERQENKVAIMVK